MIGKLKGIIDSTDKDSVLLDVSGVGYVVFCSARTLRSLPNTGEAAMLVIETHVREDHIHLYGFMDSNERDWFRLLSTVKGVGSRVALAILSALSSTQISNAIAAKDKTAFTQASGVGTRLAERILVELKDKSVHTEAINFSPSIVDTENNTASDAISALTNLGYSRTEAYNVVNTLLTHDATLGVSELLRKSLKELGK